MHVYQNRFGSNSLGSLASIIGFFLAATLAEAQQAKPSGAVVFDPITVTATRTEKLPEQIPNAITPIKRSEFTDHQPGAT